jgi:hypothetical protein
METAPEEITKLFAQFIVPASALKNLQLTSFEVQNLQKCSANAIMRAFRSTAKWITKKAAEGITINKYAIMISISNSCEYNVARVTTAKPKPIPVVQAGPIAKEIEILELRELFQDSCTDGLWTVTAEDVSELLRQHDAETLRNVFSKLGRVFSEQEQDACLDLLHWQLEAQTLR